MSDLEYITRENNAMLKALLQNMAHIDVFCSEATLQLYPDRTEKQLAEIEATRKDMIANRMTYLQMLVKIQMQEGEYA